MAKVQHRNGPLFYLGEKELSKTIGITVAPPNFLSSAIEVGEARPVTIDTSKTNKPDAPCKVAVMNPKGQTAELPTKKTPQGYETVFAPLEPGPHKVNVEFGGQEVPKSPFPVNVLPKANVGAVNVKGLETRKFAAWFSLM